MIGRALATVPPDKQSELSGWMASVDSGQTVLDVETKRQDRAGTAFEVQVSLMPYRDSSGRRLFLEATSDIRERVRLRHAMLEIEKLASMGQMAAGTAHHLNTPLAAMLLRVQMMRERTSAGTNSSFDLEQLESGILFCQHFVRRLLEFSRRPTSEKQPEPVAGILESVASFLAPSFQTRRARVSLDLENARGAEVLADRNLLEALFAIVLSNAADAIASGGSIAIRCRPPAGERIQLEIADDGCGIDPSQLPRAFEPFFTTKGPGRGTGLGLAIARNILLELGGSISLESEPGKGTIVRIDLPLLPPRQPSLEACAS